MVEAVLLKPCGRAGLVVPNIKDCQTKSIWDIAHEMNELIEAARNNALDASTMSGTTFTLSNIGTIGGTYTSPIINPPQVATGTCSSTVVSF